MQSLRYLSLSGFGSIQCAWFIGLRRVSHAKGTKQQTESITKYSVTFLSDAILQQQQAQSW